MNDISLQSIGGKILVGKKRGDGLVKIIKLTSIREMQIKTEIFQTYLIGSAII